MALPETDRSTGVTGTSSSTPTTSCRRWRTWRLGSRRSTLIPRASSGVELRRGHRARATTRRGPGRWNIGFNAGPVFQRAALHWNTNKPSPVARAPQLRAVRSERGRASVEGAGERRVGPISRRCCPGRDRRGTRGPAGCRGTTGRPRATTRRSESRHQGGRPCGTDRFCHDWRSR